MKWMKWTLILCLICINAYAQNPPVGRSRTNQAVYQQMLPLLHKFRIPGAAIIIYDHGVPHSFYYGTASNRRTDQVSANTLFEIGSVTKLFTSIDLAWQINHQKMRLDDPVTKYLPPSSAYLSSVSLEELAAHVNGLGEMPGAQVHNRWDLIKSLAYWQPRYPAGTRWQYSNIGFGLLGYALDNATGQSYIQQLRQTILGPLQMTQTKLVNTSCQAYHCAQGYSWNGKAVQTTKQLLIIPAAGSLQSSGHDMQKFLAATLNLPGTPNSVAAAIKLTQTPFYQTTYGAQGLGWEIHKLNTINARGYLRDKPQYIALKGASAKRVNAYMNPSQLIYDKTGSVAGYRSYIVTMPSQHTGIVVMVNKAMSRTELVAATRRMMLQLLYT